MKVRGEKHKAEAEVKSHAKIEAKQEGREVKANEQVKTASHPGRQGRK
jgi:hypothetical protein